MTADPSVKGGSEWKSIFPLRSFGSYVTTPSSFFSVYSSGGWTNSAYFGKTGDIFGR